LPDSTSTILLIQTSGSVFSTAVLARTTSIKTTLSAPRATRTTWATATAQPVQFDYRTLSSPNGQDQLPGASEFHPMSGCSDPQVDYSFAGYHASEDPLPDRNRPATSSLSPTGDSTDRTSDIQAALNNCPPDGIVELQAGNYTLSSGSITLPSGCTLRGVLQSDKQGDPVTVLAVSGRPRQREWSFINCKTLEANSSASWQSFNLALLAHHPPLATVRQSQTLTSQLERLPSTSRTRLGSMQEIAFPSFEPSALNGST
jgi:hypothetical protein